MTKLTRLAQEKKLPAYIKANLNHPLFLVAWLAEYYPEALQQICTPAVKG